MTMPMAPTVSLSVDPMTITLGQSVKVSWTAMNAASCVASVGWSGNIDPNGMMQTVTPTASGSVSYTLTCTAPGGGAYSGGGGGQTAKSTTLTVNPASAYSVTNLVADSGTGALNTDANLLNPWGIAFGPGAPVWVANNHSNTSTVYDGTGKPFPVGAPLVVATPNLDPSGIVFSGSASDFMISAGGNPTPARFIFDGESGQIEAWAQAANGTAVTVYPAPGGDAGGAVYKGLALAQNGGASFLYATDFHNNKIDVFDATFAKKTLPANAFVDPTLPAGYAPYGIQAITVSGMTQLYVAYAMQDQDAQDDTPGAGLGLIDIYGVDGTFVKHLVAIGGALNAPWGMAVAPADFGTMSNLLLVGNFGDGKINAYDPTNGTYMGAIADAQGAAFTSAGLWGIAFGNDAHTQPHNTLFFEAGPNSEQNGVYGRIDLGSTPPVLN
jgi:uncharacterized protein (TIGR03118 family)